jgi:hypothetical protein
MSLVFVPFFWVCFEPEKHQIKVQCTIFGVSVGVFQESTSFVCLFWKCCLDSDEIITKSTN